MIHIDSTNRDIQQFTSNTKFEIPMNLTDNMERTNVKLNSDINVYFKWVGNSESNNPLSRITNDTFRTKIIPISFQKCIVVPVNDYVARLINQKNYFTGTKLWFDYNKKSGTVVDYDNTTQTITLDGNTFQYFFENITYEDCKDRNLTEFYREAYFVNVSYHQRNNFLILGQTMDLHGNCVVENVTQRWKTKIVQSSGKAYFLESDLESLSFDALDTYIVYSSEKSHLNSLDYSSSSIPGTLTIHESISYLQKEHYILSVIDLFTKEKKYYQIENINHELNQIKFNTTESLSPSTQIVSVLPIENNFSTIITTVNDYRKSVFLKLRYLSIPNIKLQTNSSSFELQNIPFLILRLNKNIIINKLASNIPDITASFICFSSNKNKRNFIEFKSSQMIEMTQMFQDDLQFSILLPNNESNLLFEKSDVISFATSNSSFLLYDTKNIISAMFEVM